MSVSRLDYGIDGTIRQIVRVTKKETGQQRFVPSGFPVDFQLKGTSTAVDEGAQVVYDLKARNFDQIVGRKPQEAPLYLFLICFSSKVDSWVTLDSKRLVLNASAFWWRERSNQTGNSSTVRLNIPAANRLNTDSMRRLLDSSRNRPGLQ